MCGKTDAWATAVTALAKVCKRYPQLAYAGLQKSLQQEWQFLQRVTVEISTEFESVESSLKDDFLPALLEQSKIGNHCETFLPLWSSMLVWPYQTPPPVLEGISWRPH